MLVLSRKSQESVVIGEADGLHRLMKVTVLDIQGRKVRLGFEVDASIPVHRGEIWDRILAKSQPEKPLDDAIRSERRAGIGCSNPARPSAHGTLSLLIGNAEKEF